MYDDAAAEDAAFEEGKTAFDHGDYDSAVPFMQTALTLWGRLGTHGLYSVESCLSERLLQRL